MPCTKPHGHNWVLVKENCWLVYSLWLCERCIVTYWYWLLLLLLAPKILEVGVDSTAAGLLLWWCCWECGAEWMLMLLLYWCCWDGPDLVGRFDAFLMLWTCLSCGLVGHDMCIIMLTCSAVVTWWMLTALLPTCLLEYTECCLLCGYQWVSTLLIICWFIKAALCRALMLLARVAALCLLLIMRCCFVLSSKQCKSMLCVCCLLTWSYWNLHGGLLLCVPCYTTQYCYDASFGWEFCLKPHFIF